MLNSRIIIKAKSLEAQLMDHLRYNGGLRDSITDELDRKLAQCSQDLRNTHRTQETDKLRRKWNKTKEEIDSLKQNLIIMKSDMRILQKTLTVVVMFIVAINANAYRWQSPYAYCNNNPVKFIDPDGRDGIISIYGNTITIAANIYLYGNGATKSVMQQMQNDINNIWGGKHSISHSGRAYNVYFDIKLGLFGGQERSNPFVIADSWNPFSRNNYIQVSEDCERSYVSGYDEGQWRSLGRNGRSLSKDDPAPHEVGHILGLPDQYTDESGPNKGWENNIMGNSMNGTIDNRNITDILKTVWDEYDKWIKEGNKGEFKYEINP